MTKQEFIAKYAQPNMAIHCKTEEEAKELLRMADEFGFKWCGNNRFIEYTRWMVNEENTCYYISEGKYGDINYTDELDTIIIEFKED